MIKVSVIGAGTMGSGIAQIAATKGHEVCLYDAVEKECCYAHNILGHLEKALLLLFFLSSPS